MTSSAEELGCTCTAATGTCIGSEDRKADEGVVDADADADVSLEL